MSYFKIKRKEQLYSFLAGRRLRGPICFSLATLYNELSVKQTKKIKDGDCELSEKDTPFVFTCLF